MGLKEEIDEVNAIVLRPQDESDIDYALANARDPLPEEIALEARYDQPTNMLIFVLGNGRRIAIPREDLQDLAEASDADVARVEIGTLGISLFWEKLDVGFSVKGLSQGLTGSRRWMERLEERRRVNASAALSRTA